MSDLTEMWSALEKYQPNADKDGHGESWRRMTTERTADSAWDAGEAAFNALEDGGNPLVWFAAESAAQAKGTPATTAEIAEIYATNAIEMINDAIKESLYE